MENKEKRKQVIVDKVSQIKYAVIVIVYLMIYTLVVNALVYIPTITVLQDESSPIEQRIEASREFFFLEKRYLPIVLLVMVVLALHSLRVTHRFFGPVFRFKHTIRRITAGDFNGRVVLRKTDYLKDMEGEFNNMMEVISRQYREMSTSSLRCRLMLSELMQDIEKGGVSKEQLSGKISEIKDKLAVFEKSGSIKEEE